MLGKVTVFSMQVSNLESVFASFDDVVIPFKEICSCGQSRSRKFGEGTEVQSIHNKSNGIEERDDEKADCKDGAPPFNNGLIHGGFRIADC